MNNNIIDVNDQVISGSKMVLSIIELHGINQYGLPVCEKQSALSVMVVVLDMSLWPQVLVPKWWISPGVVDIQLSRPAAI